MPPYVFLDSRSRTSLFCTMEQHYPVIHIEGRIHYFYFISKGKRSIAKCIRFTIIDVDMPLYNISLLDWDEVNEDFSDVLISNNGDVEMLFNTIANCMEAFFNQVPLAVVYFAGNSDSRNRLYRIYLNKFRPIWEKDYLCFIEKINKLEVGFYCRKK
jgi:hypothetical protein